MNITVFARWVALVLVWLVIDSSHAFPQRPAAGPPPAAEPAVEQVRDLVRLLADPAVRAWLERNAAAIGTAPPASSASPLTVADYIDLRFASISDHLSQVIGSVPNLPGEIGGAVASLNEAMPRFGVAGGALLIVALIGIGLALERLVIGRLGKLRASAAGLGKSASERLRTALLQFGLTLLGFVAFGAGSIGTLLFLSGERALRVFALTYLAAALVVRAALLVSGLVLAPDSPSVRLLPMADVAARYWRRWLVAWCAWYAFGYATVEVFSQFGASQPGRQLVAYLLGLGLLAIAIAMPWRARTIGEPAAGNAKVIALTIGFVLVWLAWVVSALPFFWLLVVALGLPQVISIARRIVHHVLTPPGGDAAAVPSTAAVLIDRTVRASLIIGTIFLLGWTWGLDFGVVAAQDTTAARLLVGALDAVVILLVADLLWHVGRASVDRKLRQVQATAGEGVAIQDSAEARRQARLRTLLPMARTLLWVLLLTMATLMALAALGVQIGPLIAGAGVVGVAVGFGAQTLVRDVIAGMFYLLDDAFRVGEYIQSGNFKGTVEGFSLRSVRLRHHRGPLFTVPFGTLGAVQNLSRDWVIDKLIVGITYDSDLAAAKKAIKQVSKEISADPELARVILAPLKSQGIEAMDDVAIRVKMKIMTLPGEQFVVRRAIYEKIKKAFDAAGVKFAFPTVAVTGPDHGEPGSAAAQVARAIGAGKGAQEASP